MVDPGRARDINEAAAQFANALAESYEIVYGQAVASQERQARFARAFSERVLDYLREHTESGRAAYEQLADRARRQQEAGQALAQESVNAYVEFLYSAFSQYRAGTERVAGSAQEGEPFAAAQTTASVVDTTAGGAAGATRAAAEGATGQPPIPGYDEMNVGEVTERLEDLSGEGLRRVRDYEQRNKNRQTLIRQIDRRLRATSEES